MFGRIQGMFTKVKHNLNTMNDIRNDNTPRHRPSDRLPKVSSPRQRPPHRASMPTATRPNPLVRTPLSPRGASTPRAGAMNRRVNTSQVNESLLSALGRTAAVDDSDAPRIGEEEEHKAHAQQPPPPLLQQEQQQPERKVEKQLTLTVEPPQPAQPTSTAATTQPSHRPSSAAPYSVMSRIAGDYGLVLEESSSGGYYNPEVEATNEAAAATAQTQPPYVPPPPPPPVTLPAPAPLCNTTLNTTPMSSKGSSGGYGFSARVSEEYDTMHRPPQHPSSPAIEDFDDVIGYLTTATSLSQPPAATQDEARGPASQEQKVVPLPPVATRVRRQQDGGHFSMVKGPTRMNRKVANSSDTTHDFKKDFSSGNYDLPYTYINRPLQPAPEKNQRGADQIPGAPTQNPFTSRLPHRSSASTTEKGPHNSGAIGATVDPQHAHDEISHIDNSMSLLGPSTLRRANDLALSQWKYVAMVVKKVAEKKTLIRQSRIRPERRPSLLAAHGLSVMPMERVASANLEDSLVFAPEEERPEVMSEEDEDLEVSVYDDSGEPLLIPNLSDLFNERQSDTASETNTVYESSGESEDEEGAGDAHPTQPQATTSLVQGSEDSASWSPLNASPMRPHPPNAPSPTAATNGGAFRHNRQQYTTTDPSPPPPPPSGQHYARAQEHRYRQKMMQHQRQQLLLQQQRLQQQHQQQQQQTHHQPPPPQYQQHSYHATSPTGYAAGRHAATANRHNTNSNGTSMSPKATVGMTGRPWPQPDIYYGPRLTAGRSRFVDMTALTGIRLGDARVINSPVWRALEPSAQ